VTDVTIRNNIIRHVGAGMQITNGLTGPQGPLAGERYSIHDVIIEDVDAVKFAGSGNLMQVGTGALPSPNLQDVTIRHITVFTAKSILMVGDRMVGTKMRNFVYTNNLLTAGPYPIYSTGGIGNCANNKNPVGILDACFSPYTFSNNGLITGTSQFGAAAYPNGNMIMSNPSGMFVNFNNGNGGDYHLQANSPLRNAGTDGKDVGADVDAVLAATTGVQ